MGVCDWLNSHGIGPLRVIGGEKISVRQEGGVGALSEAAITPGLRQLLNKTLDSSIM